MRSKIRQTHTKATVKGVFCDITGTLISYKNGIENIETNEDVVSFLRYMSAENQATITLCSRVEDNALAPFSLKEEFGYVAGKAIFRSQVLEYLIDNNPDEYLQALYTIHPNALIGFSMLTAKQKHNKFLDITGQLKP